MIVHIGRIPWTPVPESARPVRPALPRQRRQPQQVRQAKQGLPLSQILIRIASAQVGPLDGDAEERPILALKKDPLLFLLGPTVQESEPLSAQGMERVGDR